MWRVPCWIVCATLVARQAGRCGWHTGYNCWIPKLIFFSIKLSPTASSLVEDQEKRLCGHHEGEMEVSVDVRNTKT